MAEEPSFKKGLCLNPLDLLSFRDGRPFGEGCFAKSGLPLPQTLAGALRTALLIKYGCNFEKLAEKVRSMEPLAEAIEASGAPGWVAKVIFRGPWLAVRSDETIDVFLPTPANIHRKREGDLSYHFLRPVPEHMKLPGWKPLDAESQMRALWPQTAARTERSTGYICLDGLRSFLSGRAVEASHIIPSGEDNPLFGVTERTGIGIDPDSLSAEEGLIYGSGYLSLGKGACFYGEAIFPESSASEGFKGVDIIAFGGEGRRVALTEVPPVPWPDFEPNGVAAKSCILLTTPAFFQAGWKPSVLSGRIAGAAVPGNLAISGWDLARGGPKLTRFAVPAGSIYFLNEKLKDSFENLSESEEDRLAGYGCCLKGVWYDGKN